MKRHFFELVMTKAKADLMAEARRGYMGMLWWVLEPVLYMSVFYVVFGLLFKRGGEGFVPFLLCGLVLWKWFDACVRQGAGSIRGNRLLIGQVYLSKSLFPAVVVVVNSVKFFIIFIIFLVFLLIYGVTPSAAWGWLPLLLLTQLLLIMAVSFLFAAVVPFLPDVKMLVDNAMTLLFFLSGVFFDIARAPAEYRYYLDINPVAVLLHSYRQVLLEGVSPDWLAVVTVALFSGLVFIAVLMLIKRWDRLYPKALP